MKTLVDADLPGAHTTTNNYKSGTNHNHIRIGLWSIVRMGESVKSETAAVGEYAVPILQRAPRGRLAALKGMAFLVLFLGAMAQIHVTQILLLPLAILPSTRALYSDGIRFTKAAFGLALVLMCQLFAPTSFRITYDTSDMDSDSIEWLQGNAAAGNIRLNWPKKVVMIANHQVYPDWWYLWALSYFANMHGHVLIVLKKSLRWLPLVGWGMQFFQFIFLARSWAEDRTVLTSRLSALAAHHINTTSERPEEDEPLNFMIFPEGTLISKDTYPISKKYSDKMGFSHPTNTLLPRSTGLHTVLLALSQLPSLRLMDVTVAYPGIPRGGYGQSYYTLRSVFMDSIPPPEIDLHVRMFNVQKEVPLRAASATSNGTSLEEHKVKAEVISKDPKQLDLSEEDKQVFDVWLRERWMEKDAWLNQWHDRGGQGPIVINDKVQEVVIPVRLRSIWEGLAAFAYFIPTILLWVYFYGF